MKTFKVFFVCLLSLSLITSDLEAGKSYSTGSSGSSSRSSSGGSSRSSFGSSSSRSSMGRASTPSPRTTTPSGRTYSTGGSTHSTASKPSKPVYTPSRPVASSPSGKTYSSGSTPKPKPAPVASSPSGKTYSTGSTSNSAKPTPPVAKPAPVASSPSGKTYSTGSTPTKPAPVASSPSGKTYSNGSPSGNNTPKPAYAGGNSANKPPPSATASEDGKSRKPNSTTFNKELSDNAKREESKAKYEAAHPTPKPAPTVASTTPRSTYKTPSGEKPLKADAPQVETVRRYVTHERYVTYDNRAYGFYGGYYSRPVYYNDYYSPFLTGWLLSDIMNSHDRALWMYHHQNDIDSARYQYLLAHDAKLQAEIDALKAQNLQRNPNYVPQQMADNPDLMYNKDFVDASVNPQEVPAPATVPATPTQNPTQVAQKSGSSVIWWLLGTVVVLAVGYWLFFVKEF